MHELSTILTDLVFILLHFFVLVFSYLLLEKKLLQPAVLFSFVWFSIITLHFIFKFTLLNQLFNIRIETYLLFLIGTIWYSAGSYLTNKAMIKNGLHTTIIQNPILNISLTLRVLTLFIILAGLPFYIKASFEIFVASKAEDFFSGLRSELSYNDADIGPLKYFMSIAFIVFGLNLYSFYNKKNSINTALVVVAFIALVVYIIFATGRTYFLIILSIYIGISALKNPSFTIVKYVWIVSIFMIVFMFVGIIYGKGGNTDDSFNENIKSSSEGVGIYMVSSLNALDMELNEYNTNYENGKNTLRFFIKLGMSLHIIPEKKIVSLIQDYKFVPYATNVYTYYSPYIRDFGKLYAWFILGLLGALQTWLFNRANHLKCTRSLLYYSFLLAPLLLSFFADQYLTSISLWVQIVAITEFLFFMNKIFIAKKW